MTGTGVLDVAGRTAARDWIAGVLDLPAAALTVRVVRERSWGDVWRLSSPAGVHWFKAPHPRLRGEVPLRALLESRAAERVLPLVAADHERGWQLTADAGRTLAALARDDAGAPRPGEVARLYAGLAGALAAMQEAVGEDDLRGRGLTEFDPAKAELSLLRELAPFRALPAAHPAHCTAEEEARAVAVRAALAMRWEDCGGPADPLGLDHNDLHGGNAFLGADGRVLVSDVGDAVLGHPGASLRALLVPVRAEHGADAAETVRTAWLAARGQDHAAGRERLELAMLLAVPQRLRAWGALRSPETWAAYAEWITALWRDIGTPVDQLTTA
ncbi:hypothetical protein KW076_12040 [Micrococcus porci]|uniref:hypothetical protein n=1 Tax=Micrococcus porci TaxID=2856555 RepID=UPI001CCAACFC|nr:hypothetical protein [Micrococcus porci]UBH24559.1 hypothetical protein KW076_12040 [Micrococcus porci]